MPQKQFNGCHGRQLTFRVDSYGSLTIDPECDCSGLRVGCSGGTTAKFIFDDPSHAQRQKVVKFTSPMGFEYTPKQLLPGTVASVIIPSEAFSKGHFGIQVLMKISGGADTSTTRVLIHLEK